MKGTIQTLNVRFESGVVQGRYDKRVTLNPEYERCEGYYLIENANPGLPYYKVGLRDDTTTYQDLVNSRHFQYSQGEFINPDHRFIRSTPFKAAGRTVIVSVEIPQDLTDALDFDFIFHLKSGAPCDNQ